MQILVAGGAGFIGSHTCVVLLEAGYRVVAVDNLCNSSADSMERVQQITGQELRFYHADVTDAAVMDRIFQAHSFDGVIHFAGLKAVGESLGRPLEYYFNNTVSTMILAGACRKHGVRRFVFSSSATVYGDNRPPFVETMALKPAATPYGRTKAMSEQILTDAALSEPDWTVVLLRYFNPVGAHQSGLIGEEPRGLPNNLMPYITRVARGEADRVRIYGSDYPTADGTGVRDYIHVCDLAEGHLRALEGPGPGVHIYNLGTGRGTTVLQLVKTFEKVNRITVPCEIVARRPGDIAESYADVSRARRELDWAARRDIAEMCRDAWRFAKNR